MVVSKCSIFPQIAYNDRIAYENTDSMHAGVEKINRGLAHCRFPPKKRK